jgi:hypothetical protein
MQHPLMRFAQAGALAAVTTLLAACSGGKVNPVATMESTTMDQVCVDWKRSPVFARPIVIHRINDWQDLQKRMSKKLQDVDFDAHMVVGGFAFEPDMPAKSGAGLKDRGYKARIKSISKKNELYTIRLSVKSAARLRDAGGPLHYALAVIPRTLTPPVFYINGVKYEMAPEPAFRNEQKSATTLIRETYGKK